MIKNSIITKYLIKENIFSFLIVFSFSCLLFISIDLIELIRRSSSKEVDFIILVKMAIFHIPTLFPLILPTVFLLSSMHTYMKLNKNNELTVLRASGFSIWSLVSPAILNVIIISFFYLLVFNPIFAVMNIKFKNYESIFFKGNSGLFAISETGLWLREKNESFEYVINSQHYSFKNERIKKNVIKIIYGILIGVIFHFLSDITKTLGQSGSLNIFLSVWSTPIIFNLLLISALIHLEDG